MAIVYFEWSLPVPLENYARATPGKSAMKTSSSKHLLALVFNR